VDVTVQDMMEARERRAYRQRQLLSQYRQTLLCFTMNIPGPKKDSPLIRAGFHLGQKKLRQSFLRLGVEPVYQKQFLGFTGCEAFYVLPLSPLEAKQMACDIEEADGVGRLFDMDVLRTDGSKVERIEIGLPGRKCLICDREAQLCGRSRIHTADELWHFAMRILGDAVTADTCDTVAQLASQALLSEVLTTPKPGLVDRRNSGSHRDMDIFTFAASTAALQPYFAACARIGIETAGECAQTTFERLRLPGRMAEGVMLDATQGVNTHRGAIFSIGILCAAAGRLDKSQWLMDPLLDACAEMTAGLTGRDFAGLNENNARTFGQKLYLQHGITGVRGEAENGFPLVRRHGFPKLLDGINQGLSLNDAGTAALLSMMAHNIDTNVIHRSSLARQQKLLLQAKELLDREPCPSHEALDRLDAELTRENISPGGSADLLAMCYLLYFLEGEAL